MDETTLILLLFAAAMGLSLALIVGVLGRAVADVPSEDRAYKDPPPLMLRVVWWPIQWITYYTDPFIPAKRRAATQQRLRKAGLDYCLSPAQYLATRLLCAAALGGVAYWIIGSFESPQFGGFTFSANAFALAIASGFLSGYLYPALWLRDRITGRRREILKSMPFYLDIITLCVEAGLNLQGAINQGVLKGPKGVLRDELQRVMRDIRAGKPRTESLRNLAQRINEPAVTNFVAAIIQAERMGMSLGPVLRAQADQQRVERFLRAEKAAMQAPIKMIFPLVLFIFPCTFVVIFFPIAIKLLNAGL